MKYKTVDTLRDKIIEGLKISMNKLIDDTAKEDGELVFQNDKGEIYRVKAKKLQEEREQEKQDFLNKSL